MRYVMIFLAVLVVLLLVNFHGAHKEMQSRREGVRIGSAF